jgi:hypothetical protein
MNNRLFELFLVFLYRTVVSHQYLRGKKSSFFSFFFNEPTKNLVSKKNLKKPSPGWRESRPEAGKKKTFKKNTQGYSIDYTG